MRSARGREGLAVTQSRAECRLYVVVEAGETAAARLDAALSAADIASALIVPAPGATLDAAAVQGLVQAAQRAGAAALLAGDAELARRLGADGVHLAPQKDPAAEYAAARGSLGRDGIIGVDVGISRHQAMTVAEAGADYLAFGAPAHLKDRDKARVRRDELIAWWAEIFEAPCVAFDVETPAEAEALALSGADFVAVRLPPAAPPAATRELIAAMAAAVRTSAAAD